MTEAYFDQKLKHFLEIFDVTIVEGIYSLDTLLRIN